MSKPFNRVRKHLNLDDRITFGAYSGQTVSALLQFEPEYLLWATKQPGLLKLAPQLQIECEKNALRAKSEKENQKAAQYSYRGPDPREDSFFDIDDVPW